MMGKCELPEINQYDIYISTGGPGDPLVGEAGTKKYYELIDALTKWNLENQLKKHAVYLSFLSDGLQTFWFGRNRERYFLRRDENA
jgi:hypothetical protein